MARTRASPLRERLRVERVPPAVAADTVVPITRDFDGGGPVDSFTSVLGTADRTCCLGFDPRHARHATLRTNGQYVSPAPRPSRSTTPSHRRADPREHLAASAKVTVNIDYAAGARHFLPPPVPDLNGRLRTSARVSRSLLHKPWRAKCPSDAAQESNVPHSLSPDGSLCVGDRTARQRLQDFAMRCQAPPVHAGRGSQRFRRSRSRPRLTFMPLDRDTPGRRVFEHDRHGRGVTWRLPLRQARAPPCWETVLSPARRPA